MKHNGIVLTIILLPLAEPFLDRCKPSGPRVRLIRPPSGSACWNVTDRELNMMEGFVAMTMILGKPSCAERSRSVRPTFFPEKVRVTDRNTTAGT